MTERLTSEREAEIRARMPAVPRAQLSLHERDRAGLLAELDAVREERDQAQWQYKDARKTHTIDMNKRDAVRAELAALRAVDVGWACEVMHDAYEAAAVGAGWETNPTSRKPWAEVPESNKATMRVAVTALLATLDRLKEVGE